MNDNDRKLFTELFTVVSAHLRIPEPREYTPKTETQQANLLHDRASDVRIFLDVDAVEGINPGHIRNTINLLRELQAKPLRYEPETEEQARVCVCGVPSRFHNDDGKIVKHFEWQTHACDGFTLAITDERKTAS